LAARVLRQLHTILIGLFVLHCLFASFIGLSNDETYYRIWARFPSWGYYDHPPMVAWLIPYDFNQPEFSVRFIAVLMGIASSYIMFFMTRSLFAAIAVQASIIGGVALLFMTPDVPLVFFWMLTLWFLQLTHKNPLYWLLVGAGIGLAFLSKYTGVFLGLGVFCYVVFIKENRICLRSPWVYLGAALCLLIVARHIEWNMAHDWVTVKKQGGRAFVSGFNPLHLLEFLAAQFLLLTPLLAILFVMGLKMWRVQKLAVYTSLPLLAMLLYKGLFDKIEANWAFCFLPAVVLIANSVEGREKLKLITNVIGLFIGAIAMLLLLFRPFNLPPNITDQLYGWRETAKAIVAERKDQEGIYSFNYGVNAQLYFHARGFKIYVQQIGENQRYPFYGREHGQVHCNFRSLFLFQDKELDAAKSFQCPLTFIKKIPRLGGDLHLYHN
jgi:4-amino-4-deoxy-L-arabinose transferase-like glycosyltransferase